MRLLSKWFNRHQDSSLPQEKNQLKSWDLSLRPNPETYVDRQSESLLICKKINSSSSSVIGLSGVRGAGKSSLAMKVLEEGKRDDFFILLISSPTGYEPREFLITVFQRICEEVVVKLSNLFGKKETLESLGKQEQRRLQNRIKLGYFSFFLIMGVPMIFLYFNLLSQVGILGILGSRSSEAKHREYLKELNQLNAWKQGTKPITSNSFNRFYFQSGVPQDFIDKLFAIEMLPDSIEIELYQQKIPDSVISNIKTIQGLTPEKRKSKYGTEGIYPGVFSDLFDQNGNLILDLISERIVFLEEQIREMTTLTAEREQIYTSVFGNTLISILLTIVLYGFTYLFITGGKQFLKKFKLARKYPKETGLFILAQEALEHLRYQKTINETQSIQASIFQLTARLLRGTNLSRRPISLPGLTAECANFLEKTADVFKGKVIICLDELDKIDDPDDFGNILRSIKGLLGTKNSHFLMTVSEDALARFSTRRRTQRDILESSLEEIFFLGRVNLSVAQSIVLGMRGNKNNPDGNCSSNSINILLFWIFGVGIPREIKRNIITCEQANLEPLTSNPWDVWKILWLNLLDSYISWALMLERDNERLYQFISHIEKMKAKEIDKNQSLDDSKKWFKEMVQFWSEQYSNLGLKETSQISQLESNREDTNLQDVRLYKAIIELIIATSSVIMIVESFDLSTYINDNSQNSQIIAYLDAIFDYLSDNIYLARDKVRDYLSYIGIQ